ncbi:MAG: diacylglycerol kinase family protein [Micromonosporaceae bacterium]
MQIVLLSLLSSGSCSGERVPVLACRDALRAAGATVTTVAAESDEQIDTALTEAAPGRLVVAAATDGELRAVLRRIVRRYAPAPSKRPAELAADRTIPDLPAIGVLPMDAATPPELAARLGLPRTPDEVAKAVLAGATRRLDLLRTDSGSVTLHGALVGGADQHGQAAAWYGRIEVDDTVLSDGAEPLVACVIANDGGYATIDDLPLVATADPADGLIDVGIAVPVLHRGLLRRTLRVEVRRSRGRAVSITPRDEVPYLDDGVAGSLGRKRSWWIERAAWAVYVG